MMLVEFNTQTCSSTVREILGAFTKGLVCIVCACVRACVRACVCVCVCVCVCCVYVCVLGVKLRLSLW